MSDIDFFDDIHQFDEAVRPFLYLDEARNNLLLGIIASLQRQPRRRRNRPILAVVRQNEQFQLVAVQTPPRKMLIMGRDESPDAAIVLADALYKQNKDLPSWFGPISLVRPFAERWAGLHQRPFLPGKPQALYQLTRVTPLTFAPGNFRLPVPEELDLITDWIFGFHRDAQTDQAPSLATQVAGQLMQNRDIFVWADETDQPVSMAAKSRPTHSGIAVNMVYTPSEKRGNGYATACVAALSQHLLDEGYQFCTLFTDLENPISNHVYQKIGYQRIVDFQDFSLGSEGIANC